MVVLSDRVVYWLLPLIIISVVYIYNYRTPTGDPYDSALHHSETRAFLIKVSIR